jgi:hypothetical protein
VPEPKSGILQGTLDLMVLKTLAAMGPVHGYGIARRIEQISEDVLQLNQGTIYASLARLLSRWPPSPSRQEGDRRRRGCETGSPANVVGLLGWEIPKGGPPSADNAWRFSPVTPETGAAIPHAGSAGRSPE